MAGRGDLVQTILEKGFLKPEEFVSPPSLPAPVDASGGKPFGKYLVLKRIGEGGFSRVYLAIDPLLGRRVALKVLKPGLPEDAARLAREARLAAEFHHPNIVPVYEVGQVGKEPYLALAYIEGLPWEPAGLERDLVLLLKVARALGAAHARGMIHRDVKPWNVLVDAAGEPHLTDFGMAKRVDAGEAPLTQTGSVVGTPAFMSPEQARGEFRSLTPAADVFSLGATLYYLATRRLPFQGETMLEVIRKVIETDPIPAGKLNPGFPPELDAVLRKSMAKEPAARYTTADEFADDLERFLRRQPVLAARRRLARFALVPGAAILLVAAYILVRPGGAPAPPPEKPRPAPVAVREPEPPKAEPAPPPRPAPEPPPRAAPQPPKEPESPAIAPELRARVRRCVLERPAGYVRVFLTDAELRRAVQLVEQKRGREEDRRFLERLDAEIAPEIEREEKHLAAAAAAREPDPRRVDAPDLVKLKTGQPLRVRLEEVSDVSVSYVFQGQRRKVPRQIVESVAPGGAPEMQFHEKLKAAGPADLEALADWCRDQGLDRHREYVLYRILGLDPQHVVARRELRLPLTGPLASATPAPPALEYEGRTWTPEELRQALLDRGLVVVDGQWCAVREWKWAPREYWSARTLSVGGKDAAIQSWDEGKLESAYDLDQQKVVQVRRSVPKFHFVGPVLPKAPAPRVRATAVLEVEAPGPILECRVLAACRVEEGRGSIEATVAVNGRPPGRLVSLDSGTRREAKDVSETVRGVRKFSIVAQIETEVAADADGRLRSFAFFLPGDAKNAEPLVIEGKVAEPRPEITRILPPR